MIENSDMWQKSALKSALRQSKKKNADDVAEKINLDLPVSNRKQLRPRKNQQVYTVNKFSSMRPLKL